MKIEHFAYNVSDPVKITEWYTKNLGLKVVRQQDSAPFTVFMSDSSGRVMIEIYNNPVDEVPNYGSMNPLILHLAFVSENPSADKDRLVAAGATVVSEDKFPDGTHLVMLRDPWGFAVQLCKRGVPMLLDKEA